MLSTERLAFRGQMEKLARVFGRDLSDELIADYWEVLQDVSLPHLTQCVSGYIRVGKYFPKPRDLRINPDRERVTVSTASPDTGVDDWTATLNRIGFALLTSSYRKGGPGMTDAQREAMVGEIRRIGKQLREGNPSTEEWAEMAPGVLVQLKRSATAGPAEYQRA
jgi:hypothetical protein